MTTTTKDWQGSLSNSCTCQTYDEVTDTFSDSTDCYGDCYDDALHLLQCDLGEWYTDNTDGWWRVEGLPLWNRDVSGIFHADSVHDFVRGITVNGEWNLRYRLDGDDLVASLSHHDVPMGRRFTVTRSTDPDYSSDD